MATGEGAATMDLWAAMAATSRPRGLVGMGAAEHATAMGMLRDDGPEHGIGLSSDTTRGLHVGMRDYGLGEARGLASLGRVLGRPDAATTMVAYRDVVVALRIAGHLVARYVAKDRASLRAEDVAALALLAGDEWIGAGRAARRGRGCPAEAEAASHVGTAAVALGLGRAGGVDFGVDARVLGPNVRRRTWLRPHDAMPDGMEALLRDVAAHAMATGGDDVRWARDGTRHEGLASGWRRGDPTIRVPAGKGTGSACLDAKERMRAVELTMTWLVETGAPRRLLDAMRAATTPEGVPA